MKPTFNFTPVNTQLQDFSDVPVKILDACMGSGKTTGIFRFIRDNPNKRYLYISLFNDEVGEGNSGEIGRIQRELPEMDFKMPKAISAEGKQESLQYYVMQGANIASTHKLFSMFKRETIDMLVRQKYCLIIDEAVDCISKYDDCHKDDLHVLIKSGMVLVAEDGELKWNEEDYPKHDGSFRNIRNLCNLGSLFLYKDDILIWEYPPCLLNMLEDVYIISYLFNGSIMASWLEKHNVKYEYIPLSLFGLKTEEVIKEEIRQNLTILKSNLLTSLRKKKHGNERLFSSSWYKRQIKLHKQDDHCEKLEDIRKIFESTVVRCKAKSKSTFWTTFKDAISYVKGKGYSQKPRNGLEPFLAFNTKATNDYRDHTLAMYGVDVYKTLTEVKYLESKGINFNQDTYALSEMIQWLWRGCIRQGKPMSVIILSERMEELLLDWLYDKKDFRSL